MTGDFGPQTAAIAKIIDRAGRLTRPEMMALRDAWTTARAPGRRDVGGNVLMNAWEAAEQAADRHGDWFQYQRAENEAWGAGYRCGLREHGVAATKDGMPYGLLAIQAAVSATYAREFISPETYATLLGPWRSVVPEEGA